MKAMVSLTKTFNAKKAVMELDGKVFKSKLHSALNAFKEHTIKKIAQYLVKQAWDMAQDATQHSKTICIDWSENLELYQTQHEKLHYYHTISANVNTAVLYKPEKTTSLSTISDVRSHKASATMASLQAMFKFVDFSDTKTLYIISDSHSSQYKNQKFYFGFVQRWVMVKVWWMALVLS